MRPVGPKLTMHICVYMLCCGRETAIQTYLDTFLQGLIGVVTGRRSRARGRGGREADTHTMVYMIEQFDALGRHCILRGA